MEARVLSLGYSILFGLLLSEGKTFLFFQMVLSILGSQSYLGCCYQKVEPSLFFFQLVLSLLVGQSYLGCCYLKEKPFLFFFFTWLCLSWVVSPIWAVVI